MSSLWRLPEIPLVVWSFSFHFVWEFLQVPTYEWASEVNSGSFSSSSRSLPLKLSTKAFWVACPVPCSASRCVGLGSSVGWPC